MTTDIARDRVAAGAAFLDRTQPGWAARIDVGRLRMSTCDQCIIGQLEGDFSNKAWIGLSDNEARDYGFDVYGESYEPGDYVRLQDAWVEAIAARCLAPEPIWV